MVLEQMVYGVSRETERSCFQESMSGPESNEWIEAILSEVSSLGSLAADLLEGRQFVARGL